MEDYEYYYTFPAEEPRPPKTHITSVDEIARDITLKKYPRRKLIHSLACAIYLRHEEARKALEEEAATYY